MRQGRQVCTCLDREVCTCEAYPPRVRTIRAIRATLVSPLPSNHPLFASSTRHPTTTTDLQISPFAGICVPVQCEPELLQSAVLLTELTAWSSFVQGNSTVVAHLASAEQQQVHGYIAMLLDMLETAKFLEVRRSPRSPRPRSPAFC